MIEVILRAVTDADQALPSGGDSEFDDWGPRQQSRALPPARLDESGGALSIECEGELAGHVSWHYQHWGPGSGSRCPELGIWLAATHRGRGIGAAAQAELARLFFTHTAVNRVQASTDVENIAEQRALERAGYTREGMVRGSQWRAGTYHDMCLYAIVRGDPLPADA